MDRKKTNSRNATEKNERRGRGLMPTPEPNAGKRDSGLPGGGAGRRDVVEKIPDNIRVDPNITEGNPGYKESGDSEIIRPERFASGDPKPPKQAKPRKS